MSNQQLQHHTTQFDTHQFPIHLVCDQVNSPANIGSIFRLADSFGIEHIHFCGTDITVVSKRMLRTARATHEIIPYSTSESCIETLMQLKEEGYTPIALEITDTSIPITAYDFAACSKIALIIGQENLGVSKPLLAQVEATTHINMFGHNSSMNVAMATGIALFEITKQLSKA